MSQEEVVRALEDPALYAHGPAAVEHVQTHISHVFLAGGYVYKLKKAVAFPFLDFSTAALRRHWCEEEVRLNARLCPGVYLGVLPLVRGPSGRLALGGDGPALDHVVWMRRLPAARVLPALLAADRIDGATLDALAATLAAFHAAAPSGPEVAAHAEPARVAALWQDTLAQAARFAGTHLAVEDHAVLVDFGATFIRRHDGLLRARQAAGRIREGHGDLRAEHVYVLDAPLPAPDDRAALPAGTYVFDCVEFSRALRCLDVASEVAFLVMDLERLGRADLGHRFAASYARLTADADLGRLLPFYAAFRACVRGLVEGLTADDPDVPAPARAAAAEQARAHFALALRHAWSADGPAVLVCCGRSGTGKTTLATALAAATGFLHLSTDELRGTAPPPDASTSEYAAGRYTPAARDAVYERLAVAAERALVAGRGVVADGTFLHAAHRRLIDGAAARHDARCLFLDCRAGDAVVRRRMAARARGPSLSDARWDTYLAQEAEEELPTGTETRVEIDTSAGVAVARAAAVRAAWRWRQGNVAAE